MRGRTGAGPGCSRPPAADLARRLLAAAAAGAPAGCGGWGQAMLAELDQVTGWRARWSFALGAARAVLVPPGSLRLAAILLAGGAAAAAFAIHVLSPAVGLVTAVTVPGLAALCAWGAAGREHPPRPASMAGRAAQVLAVAGIAACPCSPSVSSPVRGRTGRLRVAGAAAAMASARGISHGSGRLGVQVA